MPEEFVFIVTGERFNDAYEAMTAAGGWISGHCTHCGGGFGCGPHCFYPRLYALVTGGPREQIAEDGICGNKDKLPTDVIELARAADADEVMSILRKKDWWHEEEIQ